MQSIIAMNKTPEFKPLENNHAKKVIARAKKIRKLCLQLIKDGERNLNVLCNKLDVHRSTLINYLKEFRDSGFIEFTTNGQAKIVNVL